MLGVAVQYLVGSCSSMVQVLGGNCRHTGAIVRSTIGVVQSLSSSGL